MIRCTDANRNATIGKQNMSLYDPFGLLSRRNHDNYYDTLATFIEPYGLWWVDRQLSTTQQTYNSIKSPNVNASTIRFNEETKCYDLMVALPGFDKAEVSVALHPATVEQPATLTVSAHKATKTTDKEKGQTVFSNNFSGSWCLDFISSDDLEQVAVTATLEKGILCVSVPATQKGKKAAPTTKLIQIK